MFSPARKCFSFSLFHFTPLPSFVPASRANLLSPERASTQLIIIPIQVGRWSAIARVISLLTENKIGFPFQHFSVHFPHFSIPSFSIFEPVRSHLWYRNPGTSVLFSAFTLPHQSAEDSHFFQTTMAGCRTLDEDEPYSSNEEPASDPAFELRIRKNDKTH